MGLTYGWTPWEVDELTWPLMTKLLKRMGEMPSADMLLQGFFKGQKPKPLSMGGLPAKKGKVKRRT